MSDSASKTSSQTASGASSQTGSQTSTISKTSSQVSNTKSYVPTPSGGNRSDSGKSAPINEKIAEHSCIAVFEKKDMGGLKFIHLDTGKYHGQYLALVVMDDDLTDAEAKNMLAINDALGTLKDLNTRVLGVVTVSNISLRAWMQNKLKGLRFPVIADKGGDLCRSLGILPPKSLLAPRSLAILDPEGKLIHLSKYNISMLPKAKFIIKFMSVVQENEKAAGNYFSRPSTEYTATIESSIKVSDSGSSSGQDSPSDSASSGSNNYETAVSRQSSAKSKSTASSQSQSRSSDQSSGGGLLGSLFSDKKSSKKDSVLSQVSEENIRSELSAKKSSVMSDVSSEKSALLGQAAEAWSSAKSNARSAVSSAAKSSDKSKSGSSTAKSDSN